MNTIYKVKENPLVYHPIPYRLPPKLTFKSSIDQSGSNKGNTVIDKITETILITFPDGNNLNLNGIKQEMQRMKKLNNQLKNEMIKDFQLYTTI